MLTTLQKTIKRINTDVPEKGPGHRFLEAFAGHWAIEGNNGPVAPSAKGEAVSGYEVYEWLEGGYFLINRFDRKMGGERFTGMGWIGYDPVSRGYLSYSISNLGFLRVYEVEISDGEIKINAESERASIKVGSDTNTMSIHWEYLPEGKLWHTLCDLQGRRIDA